MKFLIMYRSTPHTTTGVSPAELMFGRKMRTKLPELGKSKFVKEEVKEQDAWKKYKDKEHYDKVNQAKESKIERGDRVLVKEPKKNILSTNFGTGEFTVAKRKGNTVTVESKEGKRYKRNSTEVRKIINFEEEEQVVERELETREETDVQRESEIDRGTEAVEINDSGRPKRNRKVPERYGEYRIHRIN